MMPLGLGVASEGELEGGDQFTNASRLRTAKYTVSASGAANEVDSLDPGAPGVGTVAPKSVTGEANRKLADVMGEVEYLISYATTDTLSLGAFQVREQVKDTQAAARVVTVEGAVASDPPGGVN